MRQRRNKVSTRATLPAMADPGLVAGRLSPALPERGKAEKPWHLETRDYWKEVWASPQAAEYLPVHVPGLVGLFKLIDEFNYGDLSLAAEIRLQRQCFGLTPLDQRRLQWEIERGESAEKRRSRAPQSMQTPKGAKDPRRVLRMVRG